MNKIIELVNKQNRINLLKRKIASINKFLKENKKDEININLIGNNGINIITTTDDIYPLLINALNKFDKELNILENE